MKPFLILAFSLQLLAFAPGCANFRTVQERIHPDGTREITRVGISTMFDSHNEIGKLRTSMTDKSQGIGVGNISENSSSTNVVELLRLVGSILQSIPK